LPDPDLLLTSGDRVDVDPQRVTSDLLTFTQLADPEGQIEALRGAADLYRGPFLAGFSLPGSPEFEAWVLERRQACERSYLEVLSALIEAHAARQEFDTAVAYALRYLATDELAEAVHRRLIALYTAAGNRTAALRQFERCAAILERDLGVRPLPETRAVYRIALEDQPPPRPVTSATWTTLPGLDVPLVGRDEALRRLERAYANALAIHGAVVLISGEAGIGKSRLMEVFATRLEDRALVLAAAARSGEQTLPYQPVAEALRSVPDRHHLTSAVEPVWLAEAARLLPELRDLQPDLPPPLPAEPDEARTRLLEALCRLMLGLTAGPHPLLLCLDDLHWADSATFDWILCLARRMANRPTEHRRILVLGTYRTDEQGSIDELRHGLLRLGMLSELQLAGLEPGSVLQIVRHLTGPRPGLAALSRRLHRATGGNPFFLLETLRALLEAGQLAGDFTALEEVPLPDTVREAVEARLRRLDPGARQVLEAGAILGMSFNFELVRRTAGRREIETVDGLDEAVARQLLLEHPSGYRFRHALIRQTVKVAMGPVRRHLLHRRAARTMERITPQAALQIGHHFDLGGEGEKALRHYRRAARQAEDLFAWQEAQGIQSRILALLEQLDPDRCQAQCLALRGEILASRAHVHFLQGRLEERDADLGALTLLAEASGDQRLRLQALVHRIRYLNLGAKYEEALSVAEEALILAELLHQDGTASRLLAQIGFAHYFLGQPRQALTALESALTAIGDEGSPAMRGRIAHILGYVYSHLAEYSRSLTWQQEAYACHRAVGDQNRVAWDGLDIGMLHLKLGDFAAARRYLNEHLALARRIGARPAEGYGLILWATWELYRGAYLEASQCFREARSTQRQLRSQHGMVAAELGEGLALYHLGDLAESRRLLHACLDRARSIAHKRRVAECLVALGLVEVWAGALDAARSNLDEAVGLARDGECWECVAAGLSALVRVERSQGNLPGAVQRALEAIEVAQGRELCAFQAWARMELGLALLARGEPQAALEQTNQAVAGLPHSHEAWIGSEEVHHAHAQALQALGRAAEARKRGQLAEAVLRAKAERIPDPDRRQRYLQLARSRIR
jgi:DNA-binding SARP family transcriptional activator